MRIAAQEGYPINVENRIPLPINCTAKYGMKKKTTITEETAVSGLLLKRCWIKSMAVNALVARARRHTRGAISVKQSANPRAAATISHVIVQPVVYARPTVPMTVEALKPVAAYVNPVTVHPTPPPDKSYSPDCLLA